MTSFTFSLSAKTETTIPADKLIAGYFRSARRNDDSIARQRQEIDAHCAKAFGRRVDIAIEDNGVSGRTLSRLGMQALIDAVQSGKVGAVVVSDPDRIARSLEATAAFSKLCDQNGVQIHSCTDGLLQHPMLGFNKAMSMTPHANIMARAAVADVRSKLVSVTTDTALPVDKPIAAYIRSHSSNGDAVARQIRGIEAHAAKAFGRPVDSSFEDIGVGMKAGMQALVEAIESGKIGAVVVSDFGRIARTLDAAARFKNLCERMGVLIRSCSGESVRATSVDLFNALPRSDRAKSPEARAAASRVRSKVSAFATETAIPTDKLVAGYVRSAFTSLTEDSNDEQRRRIHSYCAKTFGRSVDLSFEDIAMRGKRLGRPGMQALIEAVQSGRIGAVVLSDLERIARSRGAVDEFKRLCGRMGVQMHTCFVGRVDAGVGSGLDSATFNAARARMRTARASAGRAAKAAKLRAG